MDAISLTREQCREIDRRAVEDLGLPTLVLMENAGRGTVDLLVRLGVGGPVAILCGKGNNAGDGFVIARHLDIRGYQCRLALFSRASDFRGDAAANLAVLRKTDVPIMEAPESGLVPWLDEWGLGAEWVVDALLGTGSVGEPRPPLDTAIDWINAHPGKKMAVDVPSGLDCDTGEPAAHTVHADHTATFAAMKTSFLGAEAAKYTGTVHVCDIGVPRSLIAEISSQTERHE